MDSLFDIKKGLLQKLKNEHVFWSYDAAMIDENNVTDEILIEKTLTHLDIDDIGLLFDYYKADYIKKVWRETMACRGDYLYTLNRFISWYYFKIKKPDSYLKRIENKRIKLYD